MTEAEYVFCKWKKRLWPAKVLSRNPTSGKHDKLKDGSAPVRVEIFGLQKQADVSCAVVQPLKKETIEDISSKLAQSKQSRNSVEREVTYRRALKEALDLLDSGDSPPRKKRAARNGTQSPATTRKAPPERAKEQGIGDAPPASELTATKNEHVLCSVDSVGDAGSCHGITKGPPSPLRTRPGSKSPVDGPACPASGCLTVAGSPAASPLHKGQEISKNPSRRKGLLSPNLSEEYEVTPKGSVRASSDNQNPLNGTPSQNHTTASPTPNKQRRLCLEDLDLSEGPAFEGEGEERRILNGEPSKRPSAEAGEGLESGSDLSLSPIQERSFSPAFSSEEEDEELPSFFLPQELGSIEEGKLVWCKIRGYPYWPAVVKNMKRKAKKASVLFVENGMENKGKGFSVCLKNLKHFDCEEKQALIEAAQEKHKHDINWCINLIEDYRIRVGCNSFTGSFLEYCSDAMSFPVRNEGLSHLSPINFLNAEAEEEDEGQGTPSKAARPKRAKKLLPDRTRAARDRANQKLVDFIVKAHGAEGHLQAILRRQKSSRWLAQFLPGRRRLKYIETYLEDDTQQDLVFRYLEGVYRQTDDKVLPGLCRDTVRFILDVLFPEAIIYAIAAVDQIEYQKAEEKYSKGPPVSQRERYIFEEKIWRAQQSKQAPAEDSP